MTSESARADHHADSTQGVIVGVFPGVPDDPIGTQGTPQFWGVVASLQDKEIVNAPVTLRVQSEHPSAYPYPVVDAVEVGVETLVVPPAAVGDLGADVAAVGGAEALLVVVPTERVPHCAAEA